MIANLASIGFNSVTVDEWRTFGPEVLGLGLAADGADGSVRLRMDDAAYRISIHPGDTSELAYLGWAINDATALTAQLAVVRAAGFAVHEGDDKLAAERTVAEIAWFIDADGFRHELSWGQESASEPFVTHDFVPFKT